MSGSGAHQREAPSRGVVNRYDREDLLARTDLPTLADELLGDHVGRGRSAKWPSPSLVTHRRASPHP